MSTQRKRIGAGIQSGSSGYGSRETGGLKKKWKDRLPVALLFPGAYSIGMSNLGYQLVYALLNNDPDIVAERIFYPDAGESARSIESNRPLADFPVLLFSISFEQDYLRLIELLVMCGIPPLAAERSESINSAASPGSSHPLVIAGGVAVFMNPEPLSPYIDLFVIGEAEPVLPGLMNILKENLYLAARTPLLARAGCLRGCYAPRFYQQEYNSDGTISAIAPPPAMPARIRRTVNADPSGCAGHSQILSPDAEFANLFLTELGRGCSRGCRFCAAGFVYRPPRLWSSKAIISALSRRPPETNRVGLLGMEMAAPEELSKIARHLLESSCSLSFSSLRADAMGVELIDLLTKSGIKSAAIAPDGASERLRRVINKGIIEDDILFAAESLVRTGLKNLKLYFMIGLPTETEDDLEELLRLVHKIKTKILASGRSRGRLSEMTLSINSFVPKPWTPFQYHPFAAVDDLKRKLAFLRKNLGRQANIKVAAGRPENALLQAVLARGDRRLGEALLAVTRTRTTWRRSLAASGVSPDFYARRTRSRDEIFPWDIIDQGISRDYLWTEYQRALKGRITAACDTKKCKRCGVCDGG